MVRYCITSIKADDELEKEDLQRQIEELKAQNASLRETVQRRDDFVSNLESEVKKQQDKVLHLCFSSFTIFSATN